MEFQSYLSAVRAAYATQGRELSLKSPAKPAELDAAAKVLGCSLPEELREIWSYANGTTEEHPFFLRPGYLTAYSLLSAKESARQAEALKRRAPQYGNYVEPKPRAPQLSPNWHEPGWFPSAEFAGLLLILDQSPSDAGNPGQIISFTHDPDEMQYHAASLSEFLDLCAAELDSWIEEALL